ncbi:magnesium transporter [Ekhidna lutea]|uniref:Magnesium transporter MgtE n=1 Tax=Ekhidna lutea TaxID=447679 RepID=A0A239HJZ8_EKHLU|nr:magnesium transporter [Ekhidna lutea]SNS81680.1 magnesium transporter [Ekhidna lutea]
MEAAMTFELSVEFKDRFQQALDEKDSAFIKSSLDGVNPADISALLDEFDAEECKYVFDLLTPETGAQILEDLEEDVREEFIKEFSATDLAAFVELMDSDDGTDILYEMGVADRNEVIRQIEDEEKASNLMELLEYDEDVAGGLMAKELIKANLNWSISQCIEEIRLQAENVQKIYSVYVVDDRENLLGKVGIKNLILGKAGSKVADIYDDQIISVETSTSEEEVAAIMQKYDLEALPVVNARGRLVGRITIDDVIDVIRENAEEERQLMTGVSSDVEEDDTVWKISRARLPWLIIGMVGGLVGAQFLGFFRDEIIIVPALAFFIPLITASGGNVGIQSSSIVVQSLANPNVFADSMWKRLLKVFFVAIVNGAILSLMVFGAVILFMREQPLAATVAIALFAVVLLASFMGTITPLVLNRIGVNPALASGPFITTTNDLLGLAVYFSIAHVLYNL